MSEQPKVSVELTATGPLVASLPVQADGWGEGAQEMTVEGAVAEVVVRRNGEACFGLRIQPNGNVILTNYEGYFTNEHGERNLRLTNSRRWEEPK